ncbi:MAG TPA: hypothetical protein EYQ27_02045 [Gemmatimonadetes bacterium]|nr:hypothetical protein [Gemmatimonadota bacterium]
MRLPDFLILGPPRCGTTWLAQALRSHSEVFMPRRKELYFFDKGYADGLERYASHFEGAGTAHVVGEATSSYFYAPQAAERIREHLPDVKMIAILRDPVDRLVSRYLNIQSAHYDTNRHLDLWDKIEAKPEIVFEGLYYTHLSRYFRLFDPSQLLVLMFSRIRDEPQALLADVCRFLGVSEDHAPSTVNSKVNSALPKPHIGKSTLVYYLAIAARRLKLQSWSEKMMNGNASDVAVLSEDERQRVYDLYFRQEIEKLHAELGITVSA